MSAIVHAHHAGPVHRMASALRPQWRRLALAALLGALAMMCAVGLLATSGWLISRASQMPPVFTLGVAIVVVRGCGIGRGVFRYAERVVAHDAALRGSSDLRVAVWDRLRSWSPTRLARFRRGDLLTRFVADVDAVQDLSVRVALPIVSAVLAGAASVAVTWWLLPEAGVVLLIALVVGATVVPFVTIRTSARAIALTSPARGQLSAQIRDLLVGAPDLLASGSADSAVQPARQTDRELVALGRRAAAGAGLGGALGVALSGAAVLGCLLVAVAAVNEGRLVGVNLAVVVLLPIAAYEAVASLPAAAMALTKVRASARRVTDVLDEPASPARAPSEDVDRRSLPAPSLQLRGVTVRWTTTGQPALRDLDLDITPGRRVAVVGRSGAGKSTLASLLVGSVDYEGSALVDGQQLRDVGVATMRRQIGLCSQDAHVFDTTLERNLLIGRPEASAADLETVLRTVGLDAWVESLPDGVLTRVGEHGGRLSGGQRQRLALARALLADRSVLILDEPTEHLDVETATDLTADLLAGSDGRSLVLITHRLLGLESLDEIIVLDEGRVVQRGSHADLLHADGPYHRAWVRQHEQEQALALAGASPNRPLRGLS